MDSGWSAIWNTSNPWVDLVSSRIFLRSDASRHQLGTFVGIFYSTSWWDYQVGRYGKILSTTLRISLVLLSKSGHWLSTISMVGQRQRWSGDICDAVEAALLQRKERREQEVEEAALLSKSRLWRDIEGKDLRSLSLRTADSSSTRREKSDVVYRLISYTSDWR
jgi:hypothetical protein